MASTRPKPIADSYRRITPALVVKGGVTTLEFYTEVFDATERLRLPGSDGTIAHAELQIGDSVLIVEDASPYMGTQAPPAGGLEGNPALPADIFVVSYPRTQRAAIRMEEMQCRFR